MAAQPAIDTRTINARVTRRAIVVGSCAVMAQAAVVACGGGAGGEGAPRPPAAITAKLAVWGNPLFPFDKDVGGEIVAGLRAKYPNISVEFAPENDSLATKLIAAAAGGQPPDLDSTSGFMAQTLGYKGMAIALDQRMKGGRGIKRDDI